MSGNKDEISRRIVLKSVGMIIGAAAVVAVLIPKIAHMISKARVRYQDHPKGDEYCAGCVNFIPDPTPTAKGACMIVEGAISPQGWCTAFAPKLSSNVRMSSCGRGVALARDVIGGRRVGGSLPNRLRGRLP